MAIAESDPRPSRTEQRWFGLLLLTVFFVLGGLLGWQLESVRFAQVSLGLGLALAVLYYAVAPLRVPLFRCWMALTMPIGRAVSTGILAAIYFFVLVPLAWGMRVLGRDHLKRKLDPSAHTYWTTYNPGDDEERYFRQS